VRWPQKHLSEGFDRALNRMSITYLDAIREAQARALATILGVFIYGAGCGRFCGAFKATRAWRSAFPGVSSTHHQ